MYTRVTDISVESRTERDIRTQEKSVVHVLLISVPFEHSAPSVPRSVFRVQYSAFCVPCSPARAPIDLLRYCTATVFVFDESKSYLTAQSRSSVENGKVGQLLLQGVSRRYLYWSEPCALSTPRASRGHIDWEWGE